MCRTMALTVLLSVVLLFGCGKTNTKKDPPVQGTESPTAGKKDQPPAVPAAPNVDKLVGAWEQVDPGTLDPVLVEFLSDGTCKMGAITRRGTDGKVVDEQHLAAKFSRQGDKVLITVLGGPKEDQLTMTIKSLTDDKLVLEMENVVNLKRKKGPVAWTPELPPKSNKDKR